MLDMESGALRTQAFMMELWTQLHGIAHTQQKSHMYHLSCRQRTVSRDLVFVFHRQRIVLHLLTGMCILQANNCIVSCKAYTGMYHILQNLIMAYLLG